MLGDPAGKAYGIQNGPFFSKGVLYCLVSIVSSMVSENGPFTVLYVSQPILENNR